MILVSVSFKFVHMRSVYYYHYVTLAVNNDRNCLR